MAYNNFGQFNLDPLAQYGYQGNYGNYGSLLDFGNSTNSGATNYLQQNTIPFTSSTGGLTSSNNGGWFSDLLKGATGTKDAPGWGGMALGAASFLGNAYMGMKQYGLAKDTLNENKKQFQLNYDAQKNMTNSSLADRQQARIDGAPAGTYQSVADYMARYGIK